MDTQQIFNIIIGLVAFLGGWVLNTLTKSIDRLDVESRNLPIYYVAKSDYHRDVDEIKRICKQIFDKLDDKADKKGG